MIDRGFDFSFSGLKTAVLHAVRGTPDLDRARNDLAASFQQAVFDVLTAKLLRALAHTGYRTALVGGGVACSRTLIAQIRAALPADHQLAVARPRFNADNAAMVARAGWFHLEHGRRSTLLLDVDPGLPWPGLEPVPNPMTPSP